MLFLIQKKRQHFEAHLLFLHLNSVVPMGAGMVNIPLYRLRTVYNVCL